MLSGSSLDNLVRSTLRDQVASEEPSATVRGKLMAKAAGSRINRSAVGTAIPPLVDGLREGRFAHTALSWWEIERCQGEHFSSWQAPWLISGRVGSFGLVDFKRCRLGCVT